jgi:hypothetical protein
VNIDYHVAPSTATSGVPGWLVTAEPVEWMKVGWRLG